MKIRRSVPLAGSPFEIAPFLNVLGLLLFFLLLASSALNLPGARVELPSSRSFDIPPGPTLVVTVTRENLIFFRDRRYRNTDLPAFQGDLAEAIKETSARSLTLKADKQVPYELLVQIGDAATAAGVPTINLAARPLPAVEP